MTRYPSFERSFASHEKAVYWHETKNGNVKPRDVSKSSHKKRWFRCPDCNHNFVSALYSITGKQNRWCPYCSNQRLCVDNNCQLCYNKSFASHDRAVYWHETKNGNVKPRDVFRSSHVKRWFRCPECKHDFDSALNNIIRGTWCPHCRLKTELKLFEWLKQIYDAVKRQPKFEWCKNIRKLPFDFLLQSRILIELDGQQHFQEVSNWNIHEETLTTDIFKMKRALENNYKLIRISQVDVWEDRIDWKTLLQEAIESGQDIIYLSKEEKLYDNHKHLMNL